jgi:hypothetical protein
MNPIENDPRVNPSLAVDLADEADKKRRSDEAKALVARQREIDDAAAWYKRMRRSLGQRDRFNVFLRAEMRRKARESA